MKLWTVQPKSALEQISQNKTYRCDEQLSYNLSKKNSLKKQYTWLIHKMEERIGKRPEGVEYPIWAWHTWEFERTCPNTESASFLKRNEDKVLLTLNVPDDQVVLTDFDAWQLVMSGSYLTNEIDEEKLDELETKLSELDENALLKEIEKSWDLVFDTTKIDHPLLQRGKFIQATFWEIREDMIESIEILKEKE